MKTNIKTLLLALMLLLIFNKLTAQSDMSGIITGHAGANNSTYYVGWNAATTFPLNIQHRGNQPINFFTGGSTPVDWNAENITSGIYFYSLKVNGILIVKKAMKL